MGIKYLTAYLRDQCRNPETRGAWDESFELRDTRLVVDANSVLYELFWTSEENFREPDLRHGGEYNDFYSRVRFFFGQLQARGVRPICMLDGVQEGDQKLDTLKNRLRRYIEGQGLLMDCEEQAEATGVERTSAAFPLPCWREEVMYEALIASGVPVVRTDKEADNMVAALANVLDCPVLSGDSDFFIFDIHKGLVHTKDLFKYLRDLQRAPSSVSLSPLRVRLFKRRCFLETVAKIHEHPKVFGERTVCPPDRMSTYDQLLGLAASLHGNDFVSADDFPLYYRSFKSPPLLGAFQWLISRKCKSMSDGLEATEQGLRKRGDSEKEIRRKLKALHHSVKYYDVTRPQVKSEAEMLLETSNYSATICPSRLCQLENQKFPPWMMKSFRLAELSELSFYIATYPDGVIRSGVYLEDSSKQPISRADICLRKALYGITLAAAKQQGPGWHMKELIIDHNEPSLFREESVEPTKGLEGIGPFPSLGEITTMSRADKTKLLLGCLDSHIGEVRALEEGWQIPAASLRHWVQRSRESDMQPTHRVLKCHVRALLFGMINGCKHDEHCSIANGPSSSTRLADTNLVNLEKFIENSSSQAHASPGSFNGSACINGRLSPSIIHIVNQWQRIVGGAMELNALLDCPLPQPLLHTMYNGLYVYNQLCSLDSHKCFDGRCHAESCLSEEENELLGKLYQAVAKDLIREPSKAKKRRQRGGGPFSMKCAGATAFISVAESEARRPTQQATFVKEGQPTLSNFGEERTATASGNVCQAQTNAAGVGPMYQQTDSEVVVHSLQPIVKKVGIATVNIHLENGKATADCNRQTTSTGQQSRKGKLDEAVTKDLIREPSKAKKRRQRGGGPFSTKRAGATALKSVDESEACRPTQQTMFFKEGQPTLSNFGEERTAKASGNVCQAQTNAAGVGSVYRQTDSEVVVHALQPIVKKVGIATDNIHLENGKATSDRNRQTTSTGQQLRKVEQLAAERTVATAAEEEVDLDQLEQLEISAAWKDAHRKTLMSGTPKDFRLSIPAPGKQFKADERLPSSRMQRAKEKLCPHKNKTS